MARSTFRFQQDAKQSYARLERLGYIIFGIVFVLSGSVLLYRFRQEQTVLLPAEGGTYIEGSVGEVRGANPWFSLTNDVNRDITTLVFSGLMRYNPHTKDIEDDLASVTVSEDGKVYTATLKPDLFWHDSTEENPHPVTADDVLFTFQTIQDPEFPNGLLRQNFQGVTVEALDARTVQFRLEDPYSFFKSNLTLGLLPRASFEGLPVDVLDQTIDFSLSPIGAGPYKLRSITPTEISTEVTLERWERPLQPSYRLERIVFRVFPDYNSLLSDLRTLDGIRLVPHTAQGKLAIPDRFNDVTYTLPQYVALFFNLDKPILQDLQLRLGLQLGTNKQQTADIVGQAEVIDTPLLEIANDDWRYTFDANAAQGALFESEWYFPEKLHLQRLLERREANNTGVLSADPIVLLDTGAVLTVTINGEGVTDAYKLNGIALRPHPTQSGSFIAALPTYPGEGSLESGLNLLRLTNEENRTVDSYYVRRLTSGVEFQRASNEQRLLEQFIQSRDEEIPEAQRITVQDLTLDSGYLRRKTEQDGIGTRINDRGQSLRLTLLTSPSPDVYAEVAEDIKNQWAALGVEVQIDIPETQQIFEEKLLRREYDILLFGQSLLDNLDSYPYWHSSAKQVITQNRNDLRIDAYNLSQYANFEADSQLELIRGTATEQERQQALTRLQNVLKRDVPAIVLYTPEYTFAYRSDIQGIDIGYLSLHSDRFLSLYRWFTHRERLFEEGVGWSDFIHWLSTQFLSESPEEPVIDPENAEVGQ